MPVEQSNPAHKVTTKKEHFSALSDEQTRPDQVPKCAECGKPSVGGVIERMADVHPQGLPVMDLTFLCLKHAGSATFAVNACMIWPHYQVVRQSAPGKLRLKRLDRDTASRRVIAAGR